MDPAATVAEPANAIVEIDAARAAFIDAIRRRDPVLIGGLYEDGARLVAPEAGVFRGRADVVAFWQAGMDTGVADITLEPEDLEVMSTLAWEVGGYALRLEPAGQEPIVDRGRYLLVYALDASGWRRAAELFSPLAQSERQSVGGQR
jgi:ketosteroid isomerase-like protein